MTSTTTAQAGRDRWGDLSRVALAAMLERPELARELRPTDLAPGPARSVHALMLRRLERGESADYAGLLAGATDAELERFGGRPYILAVLEECALASSFPRYATELRRLSALDALRRLAAQEDPNPDELEAIADRLRTTTRPTLTAVGEDR